MERPTQPDLGELSALEALWLVSPSTVWMMMLADAIWSEQPSSRCYWGNGFRVHVQPDCRCGNRRSLLW